MRHLSYGITKNYVINAESMSHCYTKKNKCFIYQSIHSITRLIEYLHVRSILLIKMINDYCSTSFNKLINNFRVTEVAYREKN